MEKYKFLIVKIFNCVCRSCYGCRDRICYGFFIWLKGGGIIGIELV